MSNRMDENKRRFNRRDILKGAASTLVALAAPSLVMAQTSTLRITSWGGAWGSFMKNTLIPQFESEFKCRVEVDQAVPFLPKLLSGTKSKPIYDVYFSNPNEQWIGFERGYLGGHLTTREVPNIVDLFPYAYSDKMVGVAAFNTAIGLGYRTDRATVAPASWKDYGLPVFNGRRGNYPISFNTLAQSHLMMLGKVYGSGLTDLETAYAQLAKLKPLKLADFTGQMEQSLVNGEVDIAVIDDRSIYVQPESAKVGFSAPREGILSLEHVFNITTGTPVKELALSLINFMLRPQVQKAMAETVFFSPTNRKANLLPKYDDKLLTTEEKVSKLIQVDWQWYNARKSEVDDRVSRIMLG
jgi:putative spermidine/putrescine transport system substrate-binding protein